MRGDEGERHEKVQSGQQMIVVLFRVLSLGATTVFVLFFAAMAMAKVRARDGSGSGRDHGRDKAH